MLPLITAVAIEVTNHTAEARVAARNHACNRVAELGELVRGLDPAYYASTFATDPAIATCLAPDDRSVLAGVLPVAVVAAGAATIYGAFELGKGHTGESVAVGAGIGLIAIGPSLGRFAIGDEIGNPWLYLRLGGMAAVAVGAATFEGSGPEASGIHPGAATTVLWVAGGASILVSSIGEIVSGVKTAAHGYRIVPVVTATTIGIAGCF